VYRQEKLYPRAQIKKLLFAGGLINLQYLTPFYIYFWNYQAHFSTIPFELSNIINEKIGLTSNKSNEKKFF
jgi:hypothetical protein